MAAISPRPPHWRSARRPWPSRASSIASTSAAWGIDSIASRVIRSANSWEGGRA